MAKILLVDDDADFVNAIKVFLESQGHAVVTAHNASDGEKMIKSEGPDIALLDIMMESPDDGIALLHKLRKDNVQTPIVMLSGISSVTGYSYDNCDSVMPCTDFLSKPVAPQVLLEKIASLLKK